MPWLLFENISVIWAKWDGNMRLFCLNICFWVRKKLIFARHFCCSRTFYLFFKVFLLLNSQNPRNCFSIRISSKFFLSIFFCRFNPVREAERPFTVDEIVSLLQRHVSDMYPSFKQAFLTFDEVRSNLQKWWEFCVTSIIHELCFG